MCARVYDKPKKELKAQKNVCACIYKTSKKNKQTKYKNKAKNKTKQQSKNKILTKTNNKNKKTIQKKCFLHART